MDRKFGMSFIQMIGFVFLSVAVLTGGSLADEYDETREYRGPEIPSESSAPGYCGQDGDASLERIISADMPVSGGVGELRVELELSDGFWIQTGAPEYVRVWTDWDEDGYFGEKTGGTEECDEGTGGCKCIMNQVRPASDHFERDGKIILAFTQTVSIPSGHTGDRWMRVSHSFGTPPESPCGSLGNGSVRDVRISLSGDGVVLDRMYIDAPSEEGSVVRKDPGGKIDVVHEISNNGNIPRKIMLTTRVPDDWIFDETWVSYDYSGIREHRGANPDGNLWMTSQTVPAGASVHMERMFDIPENAVGGQFSVSSRILSEDLEPIGEALTADVRVGDGVTENDVVLESIYVDDASPSAKPGQLPVTVRKVAGDLIEIVHLLSNSGDAAEITLTTDTPGDWEFVKCYTRSDFSGADSADCTAEYKVSPETSSETKKHTVGIDSHDNPTLSIPPLGLQGTVQVGIRFRISEDASPGGEISVSSQIPGKDAVLTRNKISIEEPGEVEAVIVTNRDNLYEIYPDDASELLRTLFDIADKKGDGDGKVKSVIYYADWYEEDIRDWYNMEDVSGVTMAKTSNDAADKLDGLIKGWTYREGEEEQNIYLLIVGGDEILPFYRRSDGYASSDKVGCTDNEIICRGYYYSDMPYADTSEDYEYGGTDIPYGRIVGASADDMISLINRGLVGPSGNESAVVASTQGIYPLHFVPIRKSDICYPMAEIAETLESAGFAVTTKMVEDDTWICEDFVKEINRGPSYVVQGSHGSPDKIHLGLKFTEACCTYEKNGCDGIIRQFFEEGHDYSSAETCIRIPPGTALPDDPSTNLASYPYVESCEEDKMTMFEHLCRIHTEIDCMPDILTQDTVQNMENSLISDKVTDEFGNEYECCERTTSGNPVTESKIDCSLSTGYIQNSVKTSGYFVALGNCLAGVIPPRSDDPESCLAYEFIHKGACGFFGSSAYNLKRPGNCCNPKGGLYSETLFNLLFKNMPDEEAMGKVFRKTLNEYKKQLTTLWDDTKDTRTVTEFNLFGIPWMKLNFPSKKRKSASEVSSDTERPGVGESGIIKTAGSDARSGGIFGRTLTFSTTGYDVSEEGTFDIITVAGTELSYGDLKPVIPVYKVILSLPKDVSVISAEVIDGVTQHIGQFNIPKLESDPYASSEYTEVTNVSGLYPLPNYWHAVAPMGRYDDVIIYFHPVQHDVDTKETTLWTEATLEVQYKVDECIYISDLRTDKDAYESSEPIIATATLHNVGDTDVSGLRATGSLKRYGEALRSAQISVGTVPAGGSTEVTVSIGNDLPTDSYLLLLEIRDENDSLTDSVTEKGVWVTSGRTELTVSDGSLTAGEELRMTISYENLLSYSIKANLLFGIYDGEDNLVKSVPGVRKEFPPTSSGEIVFSVTTRGMAPGRYEILAAAELEGDIRQADPYHITVREAGDLDCDSDTDLADAVIALRVSASGDVPAELCISDVDRDWKIGLAEAVFILGKIAVAEE